jgi:type II secretion system protein H
VRQGFTLIELLVVIALIGLITFVSLPSISSAFKVSLDSATRELASTVKEAYNSAMITGKVHRVAYDLKEGQFWVESGPATALLDTQTSAEKKRRRERFTFLKEDKGEPVPEFNLDKSVTRKKRDLPRGVKFTDLVTEQSEEPLLEGTGYTHIFPSGITERTLIHLEDNQKHQISLVIETLTGRTRLLQGYLSAQEVFNARK